MNELMLLIGQIFVIACVQTISESVIDANGKSLLLKALNAACYIGALFLVLQFVTTTLMPEIMRIAVLGL